MVPDPNSETNQFDTKTSLSNQKENLLKNVPPNEAPTPKEQTKEATETPVLQKVIKADDAFKTISALSLESFWLANPQLAATKDIFLQTFAGLGNHVAGVKDHDLQAAEQEAAFAQLDKDALEEAARIVEQSEMLIQQEKANHELAQKLQHQAYLEQQEVLRKQKLQQVQAAQEQNAQQELERKQLLEKQQKENPPQPPVNPESGVGLAIQKFETQLARTTRALEDDKGTADGMEVAEDQDAKKLRKGQSAFLFVTCTCSSCFVVAAAGWKTVHPRITALLWMDLLRAVLRVQKRV